MLCCVDFCSSPIPRYDITSSSDVCLGGVRPAAAAQTGRGVVLLRRTDNEDEDPDELLRAPARDPQCTARLAADAHPKPQGPVTHHCNPGNYTCSTGISI